MNEIAEVVLVIIVVGILYLALNSPITTLQNMDTSTYSADFIPSNSTFVGSVWSWILVIALITFGIWLLMRAQKRQLGGGQ